jgi:predicted nucleic acid-binding Zn ribbon protein
MTGRSGQANAKRAVNQFIVLGLNKALSQWLTTIMMRNDELLL